MMNGQEIQAHSGGVQIVLDTEAIRNRVRQQLSCLCNKEKHRFSNSTMMLYVQVLNTREDLR